MKTRIVFALFISGLIACSSRDRLQHKIIDPVLVHESVSAEQKEIDEIYQLLTYSLVFDNWQPDSVPRKERRGYNIAALIVNKENLPVYSALNSINVTNNATQHGEVIAITGYLAREKCFNLDGYTIYTSLEPCIMCAGMMTMVSVHRVVYGQHDVDYSKAFERLAIDTRPIGGFSPYPRHISAAAAQTEICNRLDRAYQDFLATAPEKILAKFLSSETARGIYADASARFRSYKVIYPANQALYDKALAYLNAQAHGKP